MSAKNITTEKMPNMGMSRPSSRADNSPRVLTKALKKTSASPKKTGSASEGKNNKFYKG